jgi:hypothetical protein
MPAGPRLLSYKAVLRVCFFFRRKAAEEKKGPMRGTNCISADFS